jgi:hypothetical protein
MTRKKESAHDTAAAREFVLAHLGLSGPLWSPEHAAHELNGPTFAHAILATADVIAALPSSAAINAP